MRKEPGPAVVISRRAALDVNAACAVEEEVSVLAVESAYGYSPAADRRECVEKRMLSDKGGVVVMGGI